MAKEEILKPNQLQQPIELQKTKESIYNIWFSQRPLNIRTQTWNIYSDSVTFNWTSTINTVTTKDLDSVTETLRTWTYKRNTESNIAKIYIPKSWTYLIQWRAYISSSTWTGIISTFIQKNETDNIGFCANEAKAQTTIPIITIANLSKWEYVNIYFDNEASATVELWIEISFIKLS